MDGIVLKSGKAEVFCGFGRDHDRKIRAAGFAVQYGKGDVLFLSIAGLWPTD